MIIIVENYTKSTPQVWHVEDETQLRTALITSYDLAHYASLSDAMDYMKEYVRFDSVSEAVKALDDPRAFVGSIEAYDALYTHLMRFSDAEIS